MRIVLSHCGTSMRHIWQCKLVRHNLWPTRMKHVEFTPLVNAACHWSDLFDWTNQLTTPRWFPSQVHYKTITLLSWNSKQIAAEICPTHFATSGRCVVTTVLVSESVSWHYSCTAREEQPVENNCLCCTPLQINLALLQFCKQPLITAQNDKLVVQNYHYSKALLGKASSRDERATLTALVQGLQLNSQYLGTRTVR